VKSILVTGASGFVGRHLCARLVQQKYRVRAALRDPAKNPPACEPFQVPDINASTDWRGALQGMDAVIHLAGRAHVMRDREADPLEAFRKVNVGGTSALAAVAAAHAVRMVFVSSVKVHGEATRSGEAFRETDAPAPQDPYGVSKWEAEQALHRLAADRGLDACVVRLPLVYGPGVKANFLQMLGAVARGMPLPLGSVHNQRDMAYVENVADALIACAAHPAASGQTYLLSDGETVSTPELLRRLALAMNVPSRVFPFPVSLLSLPGKAAGKSGALDRLLGSLRVDSGKIRRELGWLPPYSLQEGLKLTAEWYRSSQGGKKASPPPEHFKKEKKAGSQPGA
jgi:nucleoside-diphosphate-sugar epimerase